MSDRARAQLIKDTRQGSLRRPAELRVVVVDGIGTVAVPASPRSRPLRDWLRRRRLVRMGGYATRSPQLSRLWNLTMALALVAFCLPLIVTIAALLALTQGPRNVFYAGERLGKDGKPFRIIKFKTLRDDAARVTRNQVLPANSGLETPIGKHLRDTRLDELPQLFNVVLGDMNMFGPRPVRASIAAQCRQAIPGYDVRFEVKPGLVGYTQALMPHGTDKAIRARVNAKQCRSQADLVQEVLFIAVTGLSVLAWTGRVALGALLKWRTAECWRDSSRIDGEAEIALAEGGTLGMRLLRADGEKLLVEADQPLPHSELPYLLRLRPVGWLRRSGKTARCTAVPLACEERDGSGRRTRVFRYTMRYSPLSGFQKYLIDRYLLGRVVVR